MEDENYREEELEELEEESGGEPERKRGYKPRKKTLVFEKGIDSIFRKREHATEGFTREME